MSDTEEFIRRVMAPEIDPPWWRDLAGEQRQGRPPVRSLEDTLGRELEGDLPDRVHEGMEKHFGVLLDWGVPLE